MNTSERKHKLYTFSERKLMETIASQSKLINEVKALCKEAHNSLRTFRNVPKNKQEWTIHDDNVMEALEKAIQ
jgi:hypothetical protein